MKRNIYNIILLFILSIILFNIIDIVTRNIKEEKFITNYFNNPTSYRYYNKGVLEIPKINVLNKLEKAKSNYSNLDNGLIYHKDLDYNNKIIIFGHSGTGMYFNKLEDLITGDIAYLYHDNLKIIYELKTIEKIDYTNTKILDNPYNKKELLLITCDKKDKNVRLVLNFTLKTVKFVEK